LTQKQAFCIIIEQTSRSYPLLALREYIPRANKTNSLELVLAELVLPLFSFLSEDKTISKDTKEALINEEIRAKEVRLLDAEGNQVGIVSIKEALTAAKEAGLDLVNISPNAAPPVCRIMDYGKYRYDQQKREKEAKKKQTTMDVKEMRIGIFTEDHDIETKAKLVAKFLSGGDKVKISMRFRGREMGYAAKGEESMLKFAELVSEYGNIEKKPVLEGRNMSMTITPKTAKEKEKAAKAAKAKEAEEAQV